MGPLSGIKIIEFAGIGPGPFCAMMLADMGADVVRVDRHKLKGRGGKFDVLGRGRRSIAVDLKQPEAVATVLRLVQEADGLIEGYRPGVMERLGLGPSVCMESNSRLVYGRVTGWGQNGPLATAAGHDINYIALSGALHASGRAGDKPTPAANLVGDFGGGGMYLAFGIACGIINARATGQGQIVDAAMVDGSASLMSMIYGYKAHGMWSDERGTNVADTGAHFYDTYECADGKYISLGSVEPQFYALLLEKAQLSDPAFQAQMDRDSWVSLKEKVTKVIKTKSREQWCEIMEGTDICFAPVLSMEEAPQHPHNLARETFIEIDGVAQPAPAPRFSGTPTGKPTSSPKVGQHSHEILHDWGFAENEILALQESGAI